MPEDPRRLERDGRRPLVAILPWGDTIEEYLDDIGLSVDDFATRMEGGWLFGYADALRTQGIDCVLICFSRAASAPRTLVHPQTGLRTRVLPSPRVFQWLRKRMPAHGPGATGRSGRPGRLRRWCWRIVAPLLPYSATPALVLARELRAGRCTAVLCQEYESPRFDVAVLAGRVVSVPVYGVFQGGIWHGSTVETWLRPVSLRAASGVFIGPARERERVRNTYRIPDLRIVPVFNPLDPERWIEDADRVQMRHELHLERGTQVAVWHGRVDMKRKGLDVLLEAWSLIRARRAGRDWRLLLVGSGADDVALAAALDRMDGGSDDVIWLREFVLDRGRMKRILNAADVYVFPSRHEGFAVAPLEAMAVGLPVVAADAPGVEDVFPHGRASGGIVVPTGDAEALARGLGELLEDPAHARLVGGGGNARVREAFSPDVVGRTLAGALLSDGGRASATR